MLPYDTMSMFFLASIALSLAPGPDNIFVLTQSILNGKVAGIFITLGLCTGLLVHTMAVAFGLAVLFQSSPLAFNLLKYLGAAYLFYLSWKALNANVTEINSSQNNNKNYFSLYIRGVIMNVTNPKVALFFLAFLPQFTDSESGSLITQTVFLGVTFIFAALLIFGNIALFAGYLGAKLKTSSNMQVFLNRVAATVFAALAIKLIWMKQ